MKQKSEALEFMIIIMCLFFMIIPGFSSSLSPADKVQKKVIVLKGADEEDGSAWLGVHIEELSDRLRRRLDVDARRGVVIMDVLKDSPAENAGLQVDDVIIKFDGKYVRRPSDITRAMRSFEPGDRIKVEIERDNDKMTLDVELGKKPEKLEYEVTVPDMESENIQISKFFNRVGMGVQLQDLNKDLAEYFGVEPGQGVLITDVENDSPAEVAGLKAGDVILSIEDQKIEDVDDIVQMLSKYKAGDKVKVEVLRKKETLTFNIKLKEGFGRAFNRNLVPAPNMFFRQYENGMERYKDEMKRLKDGLKSWKEYYGQDLKDEIKADLEKTLEKQRLEIDKLKEELKQLQENVMDLEKKVM